MQHTKKFLILNMDYLRCIDLEKDRNKFPHIIEDLFIDRKTNSVYKMEINLSFSATRQKNKQMPQKLTQIRVSNTNIQKLGGIHLYNQSIQRHLLPQSKKQKDSSLKIQTSLQQQEQATDGFIRQFMEKRDPSNLNVSSIFSSQIQTIIFNLKHSHFSAGRFLQQLHIDKQIGEADAYSFQELQKQEQNRTKNKYSSLLAKFQKQFRQRIDIEVKKLHQEQNERIKRKELSKKQYCTQTYYDIDQELLQLKRQMDKKQAEYQALYAYKKDMINESQRLIKQAQINVQFQKSLVAKLQTQLASKNIQVRSFQSQLKSMQDRFFNKVIQVQRLQNHLKTKSSLSSIHQIPNNSEISQELGNLSHNFGRFSNQRKKKYKQRAESVLSITNSLFSNYKDRDYFVSLVDIAAKSMRDISQEEGPIKGNKSFNAQNQAKKLFKILQLLTKNKRNNESASNKSKLSLKNKKIRNTSKNLQRLSAQSGINFDQLAKRTSKQNQNRPHQNKNSQRIQKKEDEKIGKKKIARIQSKTEIDHTDNKQILKSKFFPNTQLANLSLQHSGNDKIQKKLKQAEAKQSIMKGSCKNITDVNLQKKIKENQNTQIKLQQRKKLKKGVSFQCQMPTHRDKLSLCSMQINIILYQKETKISELEKENLGLPRVTVDPCKQENQKARITKQRLVKSTIRHNIHKKASSLLQSHQISSIIEENPQTKQLISSQSIQKQSSKNLRNSSPVQLAAQRGSYHFSQERPKNLLETEINPKISFSRVSRSSLGNEEKQFSQIRALAKGSKSKEQFRQKILNLHKSCVGECEHVRKYLDLFEKWRQTKRTQLPLHVQNLNNNIKKSFPILQK